MGVMAHLYMDRTWDTNRNFGTWPMHGHDLKHPNFCGTVIALPSMADFLTLLFPKGGRRLMHVHSELLMFQVNLKS